MLRYHRDRSQAARRLYYRRILDEKKRLFLQGVDKKEVLLLCRHLSNPRNIHAEAHFWHMRLSIALSCDRMNDLT